VRVLHVIEAMHQGGAESLVIEHVRNAAPGVESFVAALGRGGPALEEAQRAGAHTAVLRRAGRPAAPERIAALSRLAGTLRRERIDVVNAHNPTGGLYAAAAARLAGCAVVIRTEHSIHYPGRHSPLYPWLERWATRHSAAVICVCDAVRASHGPRLAALSGRFVTIANGIGPAPTIRPREEVRRALGLEPGALLVLTVGSLTSQKAQSVLIDAFAAVRRERPAARLAIAGEGALCDALEHRARAAGVADAVWLLGARADVADLMGAADVFALSSIREGLSITLLESMRAGLPAIVTAIGGNGEAVEDGVTGRVVPAGDAAALAAALRALLDDPATRASFGQAARARWCARFTAERMVRETEALYRRVLESAAPAAAAGAGAAR